MNHTTDITTGIDEVDRDITAFFALIQSERFQPTKSAAADKALSLVKLRELIPEEVIRLVLALADPAGFAILMENCKEDARQNLERARILVQEHFGELRSHPAVIEMIKQMLSGLQPKDEPERLRLNSISGIGYMPMYLGTPPKQNPAVRVAFRDNRRKLLLDSLLDWDDLLYVSKALADVAADEFEAAEKLYRAGMLDIDEKYRAKLGAHLRELAKHVGRLQQIAPVYGVDLAEVGPVRSHTKDK